jgi:hypothetical protein
MLFLVYSGSPVRPASLASWSSRTQGPIGALLGAGLGAFPTVEVHDWELGGRR